MDKILPLSYENYKQVARIDAECFSAEKWSEELFLQEINDKTKHYAVYYVDEKVVGFGGYCQTLDEGYILNIAVDEEFRNRGIATAILKNLLKQGFENNIEAFTLEVRVSNRSARSLYEKLGFNFVGIRKKFYPDKEDAGIYWLYRDKGE